MRRALGLVLLAVSLPLAWGQYLARRDDLRAAYGLLKNHLLPCFSPITYSVGRVDPRFGLAAEELQAALLAAERAWETASGRDLFRAQPSGGEVTVNMVYDGRQQGLDRLRELGLRTDSSLEAFRDLKARYEALSSGTAAAHGLFLAARAAYRARESAYNAAVARHNARGSISAAGRRRVEAERAGLERDFAALKKMEADYNYDVDTLNALASTINGLIVSLNLEAAQYERQGAELGRYEEGLYRVRNGRRSIDIYARTGDAQLRGLLAHELGHALGLEHLSDEKALMHPVNAGAGEGPGPADLAELARACRPAWRR